MDIRTSPEQSEELGVWLEQRGITWNVMIEDVGVLMEAEKVRPVASRNFSLISPTGFIRQENQQRPLDGLDQLPCAGGHLRLVRPLPNFLISLLFSRFDYLDQTFDFCEKEVIGQSHEGQDMIVMKVHIVCWYILPMVLPKVLPIILPMILLTILPMILPTILVILEPCLK